MFPILGRCGLLFVGLSGSKRQELSASKLGWRDFFPSKELKGKGHDRTPYPRSAGVLGLDGGLDSLHGFLQKEGVRMSYRYLIRQQAPRTPSQAKLVRMYQS